MTSVEGDSERPWPRRLIALGAFVTAAGIAMAGTAPIAGGAEGGLRLWQQTTGGIVVLAGWVLLAWGIHRFGRGR